MPEKSRRPPRPDTHSSTGAAKATRQPFAAIKATHAGFLRLVADRGHVIESREILRAMRRNVYADFWTRYPALPGSRASKASPQDSIFKSMLDQYSSVYQRFTIPWLGTKSVQRLEKMLFKRFGSPAWIRTTIRTTHAKCVSCRGINSLKCPIGAENPALVRNSYTDRCRGTAGICWRPAPPS